MTDEAEKDLEKNSHSIKIRILEKLNWLKHNFDFIKHSSLTGNLREFFKLRVGDWRIVYAIDY